ncbi:MAG: DUF4239 domain-containing protein [Chromatiaceae bacterium]
MNPLVQSAILALGLFVALIAAQFIGRWLGGRRLARLGKEDAAGQGAVQGAVFAMLGLLIAFTFTGASSRFDHRRDLIVEQVNAISTAWMRLDLLPAADRAAIQQGLRDYVDGLGQAVKLTKEPKRFQDAVGRLRTLENEIWGRTVEAANRDGRPQVASLVLPPLNESFDLSTSRLAAGRIHVHTGIVALLVGLAVLAGLLAGHGQAPARRPDLLHMLIFAALLSLTLYFIMDFEYPRLGMVTIDTSDQLFAELRASMD